MRKYVLDKHFPAKLAHMFRAIEIDISSHDELAQRAEEPTARLSDVTLIRLTAAEHRVLITRDKRIQKRESERAALSETGIDVLFVDEALFKTGFFGFAGRLLLKWEEIDQQFSAAGRARLVEWKSRSGLRAI